MKEKILEAFGELGFVLENAEIGFHFSYEGTNMLLLTTEDDDAFLSIAVPGVAELEDNNIALICALIQKINSTVKYVKAYMCNDALWLFCERELFEGESLQEVLSHIINHLHYARMFSLQALEELTKKSDDECNTEEVDITETNNNEE